MADLSIQYMYQCESNSRMTVLGSKGQKVHLRRFRGSWECECKGYEYRGTCRHVKEAEQSACFWHQQVEGGEPVLENGEKRCPECGGPVEVVRVGV